MNEEQKNSVTGEERAAVREGGSGERVMTNKMGTMPMNKLLLSMALPMMISMLVQALYNIVDNGVKYTPVGGEIRLSANRYELFFRIDIADNGIGIAEEEQAKIFTRFYRSPMVLGEEGVGIGLYLSREIITAQGGYIKVVSKQGQGSVFSVYLPTP